MATTYTAATYNRVPPAHPTSGVIVVPGKYTFGAAVGFGTGGADILKIFKLPKNATIVPELCMVMTTADLDADSDYTFKLQVLDGTTTKTIIGATASTALQAGGVVYGNTVAADRQAVPFFRCGTTSFYAQILTAAGELDNGAVLYYQIAYRMDGDSSIDVTT